MGFSVAFGHSMIRWADERFAQRFAGGPPPRRLSVIVALWSLWPITYTLRPAKPRRSHAS